MLFRSGWKDAHETTITTRYIAHSSLQGQLYWREPDASEIPTGKSNESIEGLILEIVPAEGTIEKKVLIEELHNNEVAIRKAGDAIKRLIKAGKLLEVKVPRKSAPPEIHVALAPELADAAGKNEEI